MGEQSFGKYDQLRAKSLLLKKSRRDNTGRGSARKSTSASAKRGVG